MHFYYMSMQVETENAMRRRAPSWHFLYAILTAECNSRSLAEVGSKTFDIASRRTLPGEGRDAI